MIFKTIDSSVDNTRKTLSLFNKDWNTYKTNWQQGFSQNGISGGIKSIFQSSNSVISKDQLQILRNWNNAVAHGCTKQETFNRIIKDADSNTKLYFSGLNKGKGSVEGLKNAQNVAKQSTIGLTIAQTALNAAISLGVTAAIMLAIKGFDKLANSAKRASEAADEAFSDTTEKVQKNEEEAKSLDELISKYKELKTSENLDVDGRKEIKEIQNDIADLVGVQASNLDLVNGKLDDEISKLDEISEKEAKNAYETATANYNNSKKSTDKAAGDDNYLVFDGYAYVGKKEKEAIDILHNAGFKNNVQTGGLNPFNQQVFITDAWDDDYNELKGAQEKADYLQSMIDVLEQNGQRATDLYAGLISQRDKYLQYIDNQQNAANSLVNSWISYSQFSNDELSKINVDSLDSFEEYRQKMIEEAKNDESIGKMLADGTLSDEDLENAVNDFMATSTKFSTCYEQWIGNIESDVQHETPILSTEELETKLKDLNSAIDEVQSAYDTLTSAVEEYNTNGGQLSIDTLQSLMGLSSEYLACLQEENGQLSINQEAIVALANAKLDEAQALAIEQAMTELDTIAKGENTSATADYVTGNAALMTSLQTLAGEYDNVASSAMTAAQAQALSAGIDAASLKDKDATKATMDALDKKLEMISNARNQISSGNLSSLKKKSSSSSKSGSSSKDALKEAFQAEYDLLKHNLEMETITEKEYYDGVQALNEKYFAGKEEYLDEYRKYEEEVYKGLKSYYKSYCDDMMDYWDKALAANKMSLKQFVNDAKALFDKLHNAGNLSDEDYWNYMSDYYQKQIDYMDKVVSAVDKVIDDEIDKLEDQKSKVESYYQNQIDLLNKQKEALEKANEARQKAIDLQKKQYELERAKNQRSDLMYKDNQFVYVANDQNIRDKQSDLDDAQYQMKIQEIENQISSLEDKMDELTGNIDKQIDDLNAYKDQWDSVAEQFGYAQDQIIASEVLGQGYEEEILAMRQDILDNFTNSYIDLQQNQVNAAWAAANSIVESINAQITALNALKEAQGIAGSSPLASTGGSAVNVRDSAGVSENSSNEKNNKSQKNGDYWTYKNLGSFNTSGEASSQIGMLGGDSVISVGGRYAVVKWIRGYKTAKIAHQRMSSENASGFYRWYASGTDNAEKGWHIVSEDNIGDEIVIDNNGNAVIPHGEQLYNFQGGEQVIPANESKEIIENQGNIEKIPDKVVLGDGTVLTPVSHVMEISDSIRQSMMKNVALPNNIGQRNYENLMKNANSISNVNNNQPTDNSISIGEIHLHEIQNVDEFSKAIIHKFPGKMRQALYSR